MVSADLKQVKQVLQKFQVLARDSYSARAQYAEGKEVYRNGL